MHGDVDHPADAVLTKDDYAQYDRNHPFFRSMLQGDLISKTFLFIGFSFEDPNLDSILSQILLLLDENIRNHYCFMKRVSRTEYPNEKEFSYQKTRQELREQDLARYGIQSIFVDEFSEITKILCKIENAVLANNVFISGSIDFCEGVWSKTSVDNLAYSLAKALVKADFKITSGFSLGIGSSVINGALDEIYASKYKHMDDYLSLKPFPQNISDDVERKEKWKKYREKIIDDNGIVIFMFGNKKDSHGNKVIADGCIQEYNIAKEKKSG